VGCGTRKRLFFALAVRITGKLLQIDGYMLRGFVSIELSFHLCNILRDSHRGVSRENKNVRQNTYFCRAIRNIAHTMPLQDVRLFYNLKRAVSCQRHKFCTRIYIKYNI